ncbi:hypothetical protein C4K03_3366 [Pseudomonas synxantha]|uniref:Uncharacterized protein n=1 Tax=Pseudomonas synxantha TaxID=47883 RepID=A0A3G7U879_9PSED|nr:hypothetical protein C4K03_3366 [Pseudomonas synxantha]
MTFGGGGTALDQHSTNGHKKNVLFHGYLVSFDEYGRYPAPAG